MLNFLTNRMRSLAAATLLLFVQSCVPAMHSGETSQTTSTQQQEGHGRGHDETAEVQPHTNEEHSMEDGHHGNNTEITQAKLTVQNNLAVNTPATLAIAIQDSSGRAIAAFNTFQEKLMHLIVVSDDLQVFQHLHPVYRENGRFEVEVNFLQSGTYTLIADYKPAGQAEQVSLLTAQVPGTPSPSPSIDSNRTKTFGETKVNLTFAQASLKAGEEVKLIFNLKTKAGDRAINDLQPYLGELGHLVILKQSSPLTKTDYVHAHALKETPAGQVHFLTRFPQPGKYKLWGQFNRNGKIVTADFWVNVE